MSPDPYRTLGLEASASMAEVKRAYRLLAKTFHPDSAGEAALPRFLAIHAAYEQIRTGRTAPGTRPTRGPAPAAEPWRADPERARTARERARSARSARSTRTDAAGGSGGPTGSTGAGAGAGSPSSGGSAGFGRTRGGGRRRETRKATLGSTSYDEARDATDASWSGASWYGPSSGEYWIVNPREYADPRKHGPDYQSRARRPASNDELPEESGAEDLASVAGAAGDASARATDDAQPDGPSPGGARPGGSRAAAGSTAGSAAGRGRWTGLSSNPAWDAAAGGTASAAGATAARPRPRAGWNPPGDAALDPSWRPPFASAGRDWLGGPTDDPVRRLGLALVAWPPLGLAAAAAIGEITGCSIYSADCGGTEPLLPWLAQAGILGLLLLLPPIARLLAGGSVAVLVALVPVTGFLVVVGAAGAPQAGFALAVLLAAVWLVGVGWAVAMAWRRRPAARTGAVQ